MIYFLLAWAVLATVAAVYCVVMAVKWWRELQMYCKSLEMSDSVCRELQKEVAGLKELLEQVHKSDDRQVINN